MEPRIQYAQTEDGLSIAYSVEGEGYPVLFAVGWINPIHLGWQHKGISKPFAEYSRHFRFVRFDRRGIGLSDRHVQDISVEARVRDMEFVARGFEEPVRVYEVRWRE
jgi:pimeloyl-ACP methyl ester carboxylesterase